ncbi:MAG: hypothetical protein LC804_12130, partial [Acidobacteria bacterium]|nr:hypothetical protein [Acidobacteriota bacterium]
MRQALAKAAPAQEKSFRYFELADWPRSVSEIEAWRVHLQKVARESPALQPAIDLMMTGRWKQTFDRHAELAVQALRAGLVAVRTRASSPTTSR